MKSPHLLRVEEGPERFAPLLASIAAAGMRAGWLELGQAAPAAASLELAAALGARRAVAVGEGRCVSVKRLRGEPVLRDLLREHFLGCALVLLHAAAVPAAGPLASVPTLLAEGDGWRLAPSGDAAAQHYDTPNLVAMLRRPHPWEPRASQLAKPDTKQSDHSPGSGSV